MIIVLPVSGFVQEAERELSGGHLFLLAAHGGVG
ncbi:MAG: hypothetical protein UX87_C0030G0010, partial [Candidatus Amesbacteria bacterium GW2011_GWA1_47_16]